MKTTTIAICTACAAALGACAVLAGAVARQPPAGESGRRAYIDPATGELTAPPPQAAAETPSGSAPARKALRARPSNGGARAWEENGMQFIELSPARHGYVRAIRQPGGGIEITHRPPSEPAGARHE